MTLNIKILAILLLLIGVTAVMDFAVHRWVIYPHFAAMEKVQAERDLAHCRADFQVRMAHLKAMAGDWAARYAAHCPVPGQAGELIDFRPGSHAFLENRLNLIACCDPTGAVVKGWGFDLSAGRPVPVQTFNGWSLGVPHRMRSRPAAMQGSILAISPTAQGPMLLAARAIRADGHHGRVTGALVVGRLLDTVLAEQMPFRTPSHCRAWSLSDSILAPEEREAAAQITAGSPVYFRAKVHSLQAYALIPDSFGVPALLIRVETSAQTNARGLAALKFAGLSDALVSGAFLIVLFSLLQRTVIRPICRLRQHAESTRDGHTRTSGCFGDRRDEIGALCRQFEYMRQRLLSMHQDLLREEDEHRRSQKILDNYHARLRRLSSELLLAQEGERRRIAVDLHDRIGQGLTVSKMRLDALCADRPPGGKDAVLQQISAMLEKAIADTRALSFELSPPILYDFGLRAALEWLADKFSQEYALQISMHMQGDDLLGDSNARIMLFQAVRELLFNIVKHADACTVEISMAEDDRELKIRVADDGKGFVPVGPNPGWAEKGGFGLFSIRERMNNLGGRLDIDSRVGQGTCITLVCPLA